MSETMLERLDRIEAKLDHAIERASVATANMRDAAQLLRHRRKSLFRAMLSQVLSTSKPEGEGK